MKDILNIVNTKTNWVRLKSGIGWSYLDYTSKMGYSVKSKPVDIKTLACSVIRRDYGSGNERSRRFNPNYEVAHIAT